LLLTSLSDLIEIQDLTGMLEQIFCFLSLFERTLEAIMFRSLSRMKK